MVIESSPKEIKKNMHFELLTDIIRKIGKEAIYETEIVKCWECESGTLYFKTDGKGQICELGVDANDKFHYID